MSYGQCPSSVGISSDANNICEGTEVTFSASLKDNAKYDYEWVINGTPISGEINYSYGPVTTLSNGDKIMVRITSADGASCSGVESSELTMTVNPNKTPTASLSSNKNSLCSSGTVTLTTSNTNAGSSPSYSWSLNGTVDPSKTTKSVTFNGSDLVAGTNTIKVVLTSSQTCVTTPTAEATYNITLNPDASIGDPANKDQSVCINSPIDPISFSISGGGTGANVSGLPNGITGSYNNGSFTLSGSPSTAGNFNYTVTTTGNCAQVNNTGTITVNPNASISLSSGNNTQTVCQGEDINQIAYDIGATGNNAQISGLPSGIAGNLSGGQFIISGSSTSKGVHNYTIYATGTCGNSSTLNGTITINENLTPEVSIVSNDSDNTICAGTEVTFTASPVNGGSNPSYQWQVDGTNVGANSPTFKTTSLNDGQKVRVILTSSEDCLSQPTATSNEISFVVNPNLTPAVSVTASDSDICAGEEVTFTASPTNGGTSPNYQWKVNGTNVGANSPTYTTTGLLDGQNVTVVLTSNETCLATATATSAPLTISVNPNLTPEVSISSNDPNNIICSGAPITFNATSTNQGANPTYQWYVDGNSAETNSSSFTTSGLTDGQRVKVIMTSDEECLAVPTAESNEITIKVDSPITGVTPSFDNTNPSHNPTAICPVATGLIYKVNLIPGATSYTWTFPNAGGWTVTSGANTNQITVTAQQNANSGLIRVRGLNECGQSQETTLQVSTGTVAYVNAGPDQTVCAGTNSIQLSGQIGGVITQGKDFNWSSSVSGGTFSDQSGNNTNKKLNPTYTIPSTIRNGGQAIIKITSVSPSGTCPEPKVDEMILTVLKNATISDPADKNQDVCINTAISNIAFNIAEAGTGATASGLPAGISGTFQNGVFTIAGTPTVVGTFKYTVNTTGNCNSQQTSQTGTITVLPDQTISDPANKSQELCINTTLTPITFDVNSSVSNVTVSGLPAGLSGIFNNGNFTISGTPTVSGSFDYTVTTSGACELATETGNINVLPDPTIDTPSNKDQELCINTSIANILFHISSPATNASVTGLPAGVSGSFNNGVFTLSGSPSEAGTFDYTVTSISDCAEVSESGQIIVNPDPTAEISYTGDFCTSQTQTFDVILTGTGAFESGTFYSSPAGLSLNTSTGTIDPGSSSPGTYTVKYDTPTGCKTYTASTTVIINQLPSVEISYDTPLCNSDNTSEIVNFSNGIGAYESGMFSATPGGLVINGTNGNIDPKTSSPGTYTVFYKIPATGGCDEVTVSTNVVVTQLPQASISYETPLCTSEDVNYPVIFSSTAGDDSGGTFSGTAGLAIDANGNINPKNSSPGVHTITYTKENADDGCASLVTTAEVQIFEQVQITTEPVNVGICSTQPASFEVVASGDNLTYEWKRTDGTAIKNATGMFTSKLSFSNATQVNAGEYYVVVSGESPCQDAISETVLLNVDENIVITKPTEDITVCDNEVPDITFNFVAHSNGAELDFTWIKDGEDISPNPAKYELNVDGPNGALGEYSGTLKINNINPDDSGVYAVRISGPDYFTCPDATSKTFTFRVNPLPPAPVTTPLFYCKGDTAELLTADAESGNEVRWHLEDPITGELTFVGHDVKPDTSIPGTTSYWVTQTRPNSCESAPAELVVTVYDKPDPVSDNSITFNYCYNEVVTAPLEISGVDNTTLNWYSGASSTTPLSEAPTAQTSSVQVTSYWVTQVSENGCESDRVKVDVRVNQLPQINISVANGFASEICLGSETKLIASGAISYVWIHEGNEVGTTSDLTVQPTAPGSYIYEVTGTDDNGCVNSTEITIDVEEPTQGGVATGPASVCISGNEGTISLENHLGDILNWQTSTDGTNWNDINDTAGLTEITFQNITVDTHYRAVLKNGVCEIAYSTPALVKVDPEPVAGGILFKGTDRVFMMCEFPTKDYLVPLETTGSYTGEIVAWHYRRNSQTAWQTIQVGGENFTGTTLSGEQVIAASNNESTVFQVEVQSGACTPNALSETAILSIIPSDIAPDPVSINPGVICLGDYVTLNASTGYGGNGTFEGGAFDNSSIANQGWRVMRYPGNTEYTFESAADNVRPDRWMRSNPHDYIMANPNGSGTIYQRFDSFSGNEGNKGFAIVSGNNPSTLETPVFDLYTMDDPTLTFDQAYNLTPGDVIRVEISRDGGQTYDSPPLMEIIGPALSGNYDHFGDDGLGEPNNMSIDLSDYAGLSNLRVRWLYDGTTGGIYTIDDIGIPQDPDNVQLIWYYDDDLDDPNNTLDQIGEVNQNTVTYTPTKIGWNYFEVQTALVFDTNGDPCESAKNKETVQVYVYDTYTTTATADLGSCGDSNVQLSGVVKGAAQGIVTEFPEDDTSTLKWEVTNAPADYVFSESHFTPSITDPQAEFDPGMAGSFTVQWTLTPDEDSPCDPTQNSTQFEIIDCTTLDFDGIDDRVVVETSYSEAKTIEAWIRPEAENGPGTGKVATIISTENYELYLNASVKPVFKWNGKKLTSSKGLALDNRWYHLAISFDANTAIMYIDGLEIKDASSGNETTTGTGNQMLIGARYNGTNDPENYFSGWIEEVRIWDTFLNASQIRFMMNQHLINNGAQMGEQIPMDVPDGLTYANLLGYYRLISRVPDPLNLETFDTSLMPNFGVTPDLATNAIPGRLHNMTTNQQNTAPLPYLSKQDGKWTEINTWLRPDVWDIPNADGVTGDPIEWNIVRTFHNITSEAKDITVLGLKSETVDKLITMANPSSSMDEKNSGQMMRVTHYLLLNGNMDLVGESQLLQDEGSILAEESAGWLERDQQGKRLSFNYNYWSSMVSAQGAPNNSDYSVSQVLMDGTDSKNPKSIKFDDRYWIADSGRSNPITISNYWIWKFLGTADIYEEWYHIGSTGTLATGEGFTMKGTDGTVDWSAEQNYVFKGKPHNGDFTRNVSGNQNYLVGNPYPSAINAAEFILDNLKTDITSRYGNGRNSQNVFNGALYFWDHFSGKTHYLERYIGGYAIWNLSGSTEAISNDERILANDAVGNKKPGQFIPVGQGFFVNTVLDPVIAQLSGITVSGGPIQFKNSQRVYEREAGNSESIFHSQEKKGPNTTSNKASADERQKIWLKFDSPLGYHRQILVTADSNTTSGFDLGYDAPLIEDNDEDMYWFFNDYEFVIQAVEDFNVDRELDLGMKIHEKGNITISIDELKNIPDDMEIFLKDSLLQVTHDLRKVKYTATSDTGTFHNRFKIIFKDPNAVIEPEDEIVEEEETGEFEILYVNGSREILVRNPQLINIDRIYLNNVLGQQIHVYYDIPGEKELRLPVHRFSSGVYIVKVHSEKGIRTKKIILE